MAAHSQRLNIYAADPAAYRGPLAMEKYVDGSGLDPQIRELVKIRASQLNGCAYCLEMHLYDAREAGEDQRRLDVLAAWREAPSLFTAQEQAALVLTEAVTRIGEAGVPDETWDEAAAQFNENELIALLIAISAINVWNRLAIATRQDLIAR